MTRFVIGALAIALFACPVQTSAAPFTELFVFGDSLSDMGNAHALTSGLFPPSPPYAMRFSNGPAAAEYLAANLGVLLAPSVAGGTNFAVGGATTGVANYNFEINSPAGVNQFAALATSGISAQVAQFLSAGLTIDPATSLFLLWGGPNDFFLALDTGGDLGAAIGSAVTNLAVAVGALALAGGQHVLVPNMVNLAATPFGQALDPILQAGLLILTQTFNSSLAAAMANVERGLQQLGIPLDVILFDTFSAFNQVVQDPGAFGFTNATTPCLFTPDLATGCVGYVFFDGVHPTTAAHAVLGDLFTSAVVPEPATALLVLAGVAGLVLIRSRRGGWAA